MRRSLLSISLRPNNFIHDYPKQSCKSAVSSLYPHFPKTTTLVETKSDKAYYVEENDAPDTIDPVLKLGYGVFTGLGSFP